MIGLVASRGASRSTFSINFGSGVQLVQILCHDSLAVGLSGSATTMKGGSHATRYCNTKNQRCF